MNQESEKIQSLHYDDLNSYSGKLENMVFFDDFYLVGTFNDESRHFDLLRGGLVGVCLEGSAEVFVNGQNIHIEKGFLLVVFPQHSLQIAYCSSDFKAYLTCVHRSFFECLSLAKFAQIYLNIEEISAVKMSDEEQNNILNLVRNIRSIFDGNHIYRNEIIEHLIQIFAYEVAAIFNKKRDVKPIGTSEIYFQKFLKLLVDNIIEHRTLQFYADELCITPRHLTQVIKSVTNITPTDWIERITIQKAKELLISTDLSVQEISYRLNFATPTFFSQYFKRNTNMTPMAFRTKCHQDD